MFFGRSDQSIIHAKNTTGHDSKTKGTASKKRLTYILMDVMQPVVMAMKKNNELGESNVDVFMATLW